jgi:riboflavin transporter FmnP
MQNSALLVRHAGQSFNLTHILTGVMMNQIEITQRKSRTETRMLTASALLAAVSYILAYIEVPVPLSPAFAKMDLSDFPALIGAFAFGPVAGLFIELVKNALQIFSTSTGGVGELANFIMGGSFVFTAGMIYRLRKTKRTAVISCAAASVVMGIAAVIANYFILLPMFETFMPMEQIIAAFGEFIPFIRTKLDVVLFNAFPFNLLKGLVISVFTMLTYKKLTPVLGRVR